MICLVYICRHSYATYIPNRVDINRSYWIANSTWYVLILRAITQASAFTWGLKATRYELYSSLYVKWGSCRAESWYTSAECPYIEAVASCAHTSMRITITYDDGNSIKEFDFAVNTWNIVLHVTSIGGRLKITKISSSVHNTRFDL